MKKIVFIIIFSPLLVKGQSYDINGNYKISGNVGIGTDSPTSQLELLKTGTATVQLGREGSHGSLVPLGQINFYEGQYDNAISSRIEGTRGPGTAGRGELVFSTLQSSGSSLAERMRISYTGDIGIGTSTPGTYNTTTNFQIYDANDIVLDIQGGNNTGWVSTGSNIDNGVLGGLAFTKPNGQGDAHKQVAFIRASIVPSAQNNAMSTLEFGTKSSGGFDGPDMIIDHSGRVGIGTTNTFGYKLAVNGTIGSTEVKVENTSAWPDFVLKKDFELRTLKEVEQYINENGHLPEIPSEAEVTENGINLGEMNAKLLQKIEELTLYLIEQNKQNLAQQARIEQLERELNVLKNK